MFGKRFFVFVAVVFALFSIPLIASAAVGPIRVNNDVGYAHNYPAAVVLKNGTIVVTYQIQDDNTNGQVMVARSVDGGIHWIDHRLISQSNTYQTAPKMATDGQNIWVVLSEKDLSVPIGVIDNDIVLYTSHDAGLTWSRKELNEADPSGNDSSPVIDYNRGQLYVVWYDKASTTDPGRMVARHSCDLGKTWDQQVTVTDYTAIPSDILAYRDWLLLAFTSTQRRPWYADVYVTSSKNFGGTWSTPELISGALPDWYRARHPQFFEDSGSLRLVWWDDMYGHFKGIQSIYESGGSWGDAEVVPALDWMHQAHAVNYAGKGFLAWRNQYGEALVMSTIMRGEWVEVYRLESPEGLGVNNPFLLGQGRFGLRAFWAWSKTNGYGDVVTLRVKQPPRVFLPRVMSK